MKPSLQVRLSQHLALTPQLQQSIRLLQLSTLELHQEVEQMLEQNPFLEAEEDEPGFEPTADRPAPGERGVDAEGSASEGVDEPEGTDVAGFATTGSVDWGDSAAGDDQRLRFAQQLLVGAGGGHQLPCVAAREQVQMVLADQDRDHLRLAARQRAQLQLQAFGQVARTHAGGFHALQPFQRATQSFAQLLAGLVVVEP